MSRIQRLITAASATLLVAALAGPAYAQSDDVRSPDAIDAGTPAAVAPAPAADVLDARSPDARDAAAGATPVVVHVEPDADDGGMSWDSAAIGALIGAGLLAAFAGIATLVSRRRTPRPAV